MNLLKSTLFSLALTLLCLSSFAQRIEIHGRDTSAVVPIGALRKANERTVELQQCREENDSLFGEIRSYTGLVANQKATIIDLKDAIGIDFKLLTDKDAIQGISNKELKRQSMQITLLRIERNGLALAVGIAALKIFLFK